MSNKITGNEPAMPNGAWGQQTGTGLTIRQQFALSCLQGMLANAAIFSAFPESMAKDAHKLFAEAAIEHADVLIEELNKKTN